MLFLSLDRMFTFSNLGSLPSQVPDIDAASTRLLPAEMCAPLPDVADEVRAYVALHLRGAATPYPLRTRTPELYTLTGGIGFDCVVEYVDIIACCFPSHSHQTGFTHEQCFEYHLYFCHCQRLHLTPSPPPVSPPHSFYHTLGCFRQLVTTISPSHQHHISDC